MGRGDLNQEYTLYSWAALQVGSMVTSRPGREGVTVPAAAMQLPVDLVSIVRLHGEACITCGTTTLPLIPNGHVRTGGTDDGVLSWPVVACPDHLGRRLC